MTVIPGSFSIIEIFSELLYGPDGRAAGDDLFIFCWFDRGRMPCSENRDTRAPCKAASWYDSPARLNPLALILRLESTCRRVCDPVVPCAIFMCAGNEYF